MDGSAYESRMGDRQPQRLGIYGIRHDPHRMGLPASSEVTPDRIIHALPELLPEDIRKTI